MTWTSTSRAAVWAAMRDPGLGFRGPQMLTVNAGSMRPVRRWAPGGPRRSSTASSTCRPARATASSCIEPSGAVHSVRPEEVDPGNGVTIGEATGTPGGRVLVGLDRPSASEPCTCSEAAPGGPLVDAGELGANVASARVAVAADDDGRAAVAWSELVSTEPMPRERTVAALRPGGGAPFGRAVALGRSWRAPSPVTARLLPDGVAMVVWTGDRFTGPARRRTALAVTRLP